MRKPRKRKSAPTEPKQFSAAEAKRLSNKYAKRLFDEQLNSILEKLKSIASAGPKQFVTDGSLLPKVKTHLIGLGFIVDPSTGPDDVGRSSTMIRW